MRFLWISIFSFFFIHTNAQNISEGEISTSLTEEQCEVNESLYKLNLNEAGREELMASGILTEHQVDQLLAWRQRYGKLLSVYELQAIPDFTLETIWEWQAWGKLYVEENKESYATEKTSLTYRTSSLWPRSRGYATERYPGLPWSSYFRARHTQKNYTIGIVLEQDAGERRFFYDHISMYISFHSLHPHWKIIFGDFRSGFGRGLVCGARAAMLSGAAGMPLIFQPGIIANTSAAEYGYGRGIAATWMKKQHGVHLFLSSRLIDVRVYEMQGKKYISSFLNSGLHRTASEEESRMNSNITSGGIHGYRKFSSGSIGLTLFAFFYEHPVLASSAYYRRFNFYGKTGGNASVDFTWQYGPVLVTGEIALDARGKKVLLLQGLLAAGKYADLGVVLIHYDAGYYAPLALTISRHTQPENEKGISLYANLNPSSTLQLRLQSSVYKIPWLTYGTKLPASGSAYQLMVQRQFSKSALFKIQYRFRTEDQGLSGDSLLLPVTGREKQQYVRAEFQYQVRAGIKVYAIAQAQRYRLAGVQEKGSVMVMGVQQQWKMWKFKLALAMFHTDSYASRLYVYEQGAGADFRFRALYGSGTQYIAGVKFRWSKAASISVKYSYMRMPGQASSGSGYDERAGDKVQEFSVQYNGEF